MALKLIVECAPNQVRFITFEQDEDFGHWQVKDILEFNRALCIKRGPHYVAAHFDHAIDPDDEFESVELLWSSEQMQGTLGSVMFADYRRQRSYIECVMAVVICEYLGCRDNDGEILSGENGHYKSESVMFAFLRDLNESGDFGPYFRQCYA